LGAVGWDGRVVLWLDGGIVHVLLCEAEMKELVFWAKDFRIAPDKHLYSQ